jgi:hypothetical protein
VGKQNVEKAMESQTQFVLHVPQPLNRGGMSPSRRDSRVSCPATAVLTRLGFRQVFGDAEGNGALGGYFPNDV